jgi:hypothetical protein
MAWPRLAVRHYSHQHQAGHGFLVEREDDAGHPIDDERLTDILSDRLIDVWSAIKSQTMSASGIREHVIPFSVNVQLDRHFAGHRALVSARAA